MAEAYVLFKRLHGPTGTIQSVVRVFDSEAEAKAASARGQAELMGLLNATVALTRGDEAIPVCSVRDFLASFGIHEVSHLPVKVGAGLIEEAAPKLIVPS